MTLQYSNPALDAELAYRREVLRSSRQGTRTRSARGGGWFGSRRRAH